MGRLHGMDSVVNRSALLAVSIDYLKRLWHTTAVGDIELSPQWRRALLAGVCAAQAGPLLDYKT